MVCGFGGMVPLKRPLEAPKGADVARPEGGSSFRTGNLPPQGGGGITMSKSAPIPHARSGRCILSFMCMCHLPNLAVIPVGTNPPSAEVHRLRGEFLRWVANKFVGDGRDPCRGA